jgi:hypothetical protein
METVCDLPVFRQFLGDAFYFLLSLRALINSSNDTLIASQAMSVRVPSTRCSFQKLRLGNDCAGLSEAAFDQMA